MAGRTLEELKRERDNRIMASRPTPEIIPNEEMRNTPPREGGIHVTPPGEPIDTTMRRGGDNSELNALKAEQLRRKEGPQASSTPAQDSPILTNPIPTGIEEIDSAGQQVTDYVGPRDSARQRGVPGLDSYEFDDPIRVRAALASQGVDFKSGGPGNIRAAEAQGTSIPRLREQAVKQAIMESGMTAPEGHDNIKYSQALDQFFLLMPDQQNPGKFRWTAMDGSGIERGDFADMLDPAEIISMAGAVGATFLDPTKGAGKVFGLGLKGAQKSAAARGWTGGIGGRVVGEGAEIALNYMRTGNVPTVQELYRDGWSGLQVETFAAITGELGAKMLRMSGVLGQELIAKLKGKRGAYGTAEDIASANKNINETREDMVRVRDVTGREDLMVTPGTATHSIDIIEREGSGLSNTSRANQREFKKGQARSGRVVQDYIDTVFKGDPNIYGARAGTIVAANDAIGTSGQITIAQTVNQSGESMLHYAPKGAPDLGLKVKPEAGYWQVRGASLKDADAGIDLTGTGLGKEMYTAAAKEAQSYGKAFASDLQVSVDAMNVWKSVDNNETFGRLIWNENVETVVDGRGRSWIKSLDGEPVVRTETPKAVTPVLLEEFGKTGRGEGGKFEAAKEFTRFLRRPGRMELGTVVEEINSNPFIKQDLKEAILADFERNVKVNGEFNEAAWEVWKDDTGRVLEEVFSPEDMIHIRTKSNGLREAVAAERGQTELAGAALARNLGVDRSSILLKDNKSIWTQMKGRSSRDRRRTMRVLDQTGQGKNIRELFKEDLRLDLRIKTKGANADGYNKWLGENRDLIRDMTGTVYYNDLKTLGNILKRKSDRGMVTSSAADANPTMLGFTRVVFGPLSRAQRFISAGRRGQIRSAVGGGFDPSDLITDPNLLHNLIRLRPLQLESRVAARFLQDSGLADKLSGGMWFGGESYDANKPEHHAELVKNVNLMLQEEDLNPDGNGGLSVL